MIYRGLADFVFILHLAFVVFVIFGGMLALRWRKILWLHVPAVIWGIFLEFFQLPCPLTNLEKRLKALGGDSGYEGGFIEYYASAILYAHVTPQIQLTLGILLLAFNLFVYWRLFHKARFSIS